MVSRGRPVPLSSEVLDVSRREHGPGRAERLVSFMTANCAVIFGQSADGGEVDVLGVRSLGRRAKSVSDTIACNFVTRSADVYGQAGPADAPERLPVDCRSGATQILPAPTVRRRVARTQKASGPESGSACAALGGRESIPIRRQHAGLLPASEFRGHPEPLVCGLGEARSGSSRRHLRMRGGVRRGSGRPAVARRGMRR